MIKKSHDDPELSRAQAEIAKSKQNDDDDEDNLSEIDVENVNDYSSHSDDDFDNPSQDDTLSSRSTRTTPSERKSKKNLKKGGSSGTVSRDRTNKNSAKDRSDHDEKKTKKGEVPSSEESLRSSVKSTKSSLSEGNFGLSDHECSSADEKTNGKSFYPAKLEADKDKSLWACSRKTKKFMGKKLLNSLFQSGIMKKVSLDNDSSYKLNSSTPQKISGFRHLTRDSSPESSDEEEEYLKELKTRQIKTITETNDLYKVIERDKINPNINELTGLGRRPKMQVCELDDLIHCVNKVQTDDEGITKMKEKLNDRLHKESIYFPIRTTRNIAPVQLEDVNFSSVTDTSVKTECFVCDDSECEQKNTIKDSVEKSPSMKYPINLEKSNGPHIIRKVDKMSLNATFDNEVEKIKNKLEKKYSNPIDPLIISIFGDTNRCLDSSLSKKRHLFSKNESKMRNMFNAFKEEMIGNANDDMDDSESESMGRNEGDLTISDEERANEKDVDSVEGDIYNSDDNYSMQSKNASSSECNTSTDNGESNGEKKDEVVSCYSENDYIIEYQTEAPTHHPYNFNGFHFQAGKMYARKLYQLKEVCDNIAIDSDQQSAYEGDDDYNADFLQGEIDKFLDNTVDKINQDVREARTLIGGFKVSSRTNLDQTGVYYCNLSDRYINYVDSYFRKINKKREVQSDKAYLMELLKKKAREPDKIIKHIREYINCKKYGIAMELDENIMNLVPHVRPVQVKKKDRLGYEILTDDDDDEESVEIHQNDEDAKGGGKESIEPVNITMAQLVDRLKYSPNLTRLLDSVNNLKKFKDMETVNQLVELPLHECFSDVNIRNHLQNSKVNDGYYIDASIEGKVRSEEDYNEKLGFVTDPEHVVLSKDFESLSLQSESEQGEEIKVKHMEILTNCGKETIKEADFFEPIYKTDSKCPDPFKPEKFRMFAPIDPLLLDSDSDGTINTRIRSKRRKAMKPKPKQEEEEPVSAAQLSETSGVSDLSALSIQKKVETDKCYGLEPILQKNEATCRVGVKNVSTLIGIMLEFATLKQSLFQYLPD